MDRGIRARVEALRREIAEIQKLNQEYFQKPRLYTTATGDHERREQRLREIIGRIRVHDGLEANLETSANSNGDKLFAFSGGDPMRKATIGLLLLLCSLAAFGQTQPQWRVVQHVILTHQSAPIPQSPLFTPTKPGLYRLSAYISAESRYANWNLRVSWTDAAGNLTNTYITAETGPCTVGQNCTAAEMSHLLVPKGRTPSHL